MLQRIRQLRTLPGSPEIIAAALLLTLGAALRLYALGEIPLGFNSDEATSAYEAWSLLHFGIDRHGFSWPVHFVAAGSGHNALYSYLAIPFIALGGPTIAVFRLPMALTGILALFLMWKIGARAENRAFALLTLLLLTFNVWHLIATRWALEVNLLPFVLLLSVYFLSRSDRHRFSIQAAAVFILAMSVYAYGAAYAFAPLFLALVFIWLRLNRLADWRRLLSLSALAFATALPIMLLVAINSFGLDSITVLGVSIPRYTASPRYENISLLFYNQGERVLANLPALAAGLLQGQWSNAITKVMPGFGVLPPLALLLILFGLGSILYRAKTRREYGVHLLMAFWFGAAALLALTVSVEVQRINALWLPAIYLTALGAFRISRHRLILYALAAAYIAYSSVFIWQYFQNYRDLAAEYFHPGLRPAVARAVAAAGPDAVSVTSSRVPSASLVSFYAQIPPGEYQRTGIISLPNAHFSSTLALGQFLFVSPLPRKESERLSLRLLQAAGIDHEKIAHYVLTNRDLPKLDPGRFILEKYGNYYYAYDPAIAAAGAAQGPLLRVDRPPVAAPPAAQSRFTVYLENNALTYYKAGCTAYDTREWFFLHITPAAAADLPQERQQIGFANRDFRFDRHGALYGPNCWAIIPLPDYPIAAIHTGQFSDKGELWRVEFPVQQ